MGQELFSVSRGASGQIPFRRRLGEGGDVTDQEWPQGARVYYVEEGDPATRVPLGPPVFTREEATQQSRAPENRR